MKQLALMAARAERSRLGPAARQRVLSEAVEAMARPAVGHPALSPAHRILVAAAVLVVLAIPAVLTLGPGKDRAAGDENSSLNLQARLSQDGGIILEWQNGRSVHTVRRATSAAELSKVAGVTVNGGQFLDHQAGGADIVYYQVD